MVDRKVLIGILTNDYMRRSDFYDYFNTLIKPLNTMVYPSHDRSPAHGRNLIIQQALDLDCTHILFLDDDMAFLPDSLNQLLEHDVDIVSGLYLSKAYPHEPIVFDVAEKDGSCLPMYLDGNRSRLIEVVAAGLGFCLIKTSVFRRLDKPWIRLGELDSEQWCDDLGFFKRVRESNFKIYCDMQCLIGHIGSMIIWPNIQDGKWFTGYDTGGKGRINTPQMIPIVSVPK